jgi:LPXTG-site transpeptidase (sortase) family protein
MKRKNLSIYIAVAITIAAVAVFAETFVHAAVYDPDSEIQVPAQALAASAAPSASGSAATSTRTESVISGVINHTVPVVLPAKDPVRLSIPALGIDAHVQETGITTHDTIGTPTNFTDVAWYMYGPVPGDPGSAIIDGHVDNGLGLAGVFKHLSGIQTGDDIYVTTQGGTQLHFKVTDIESYDYKNVPIASLSSDTGEPTLRLITCGGTWVPGGDTYDQRLVVTAVLVP